MTVLMSSVDIPLPLTNGMTPTQLNDTTSPQLPANLLAPHNMWEMATGSSDLFIPMEKITGGLPDLQPSSYLRIWEWREDSINMFGATQAVTVRIRYEKSLPALTLGTDPVQIRYATDPLGYTTAAMAARSRGSRALAADMAPGLPAGHRKTDRAVRAARTAQGAAAAVRLSSQGCVSVARDRVRQLRAAAS